MKSDEIKQLEKFYNCLTDYLPKLNSLCSYRTEFEEFSKVDPLAEFDTTQMEQYLVEKAGAEPKKALFNIGKKKIEYESAMQQWTSKVEEAKKSYYVDKKDERDSIKNSHETEINKKKSILDNLASEEKEAREKLKKSDLDLGEPFFNPNAVEKLLTILKSKRADSIKEALNIYFLEQRFVDMEETLKGQQEEIQSTKLLANEALAKAKESFDLADSAYRKAQDAYRLAQEADSTADDAERAVRNIIG